MKQQTLKKEVGFSGIGLHTGVSSNIKIKPSKENTGIKFIRVDITDENNEIPALANYVIDTARSTKIGLNEKVSVSTLEHLMAGFCGCGIDNAIVEIDGPEVPILDGSSKPYVDAFLEIGIKEQKEKRQFINIEENITVKDEETGSEMVAIPSKEFSVEAFIDFKSDALTPQLATLNSLDEFEEKFADCKTFCFLHEIEYLISQNLIKGGSIENAIVYVNGDRKINKKTKEVLSAHIPEEKISVSDKGILNNVELKYDNEAGRHKLLDVIGDLYLLGKRINAKIIAKKPGHKVNVALAKKILSHLERTKNIYNPQAKPVKDITSINKTLPHRYPFLLVDKIIELTEKRVVGVKNVTINEPFFQGHFPDNPIMPGVLQIEAMAQAGGILALSTVPDPENYSTYFMKIDKVKFKRKVIPGDSIVFVIDLTAPIRRGIVQVKSYAYVDEELATEAELAAYIVKEKNL